MSAALEGVQIDSGHLHPLPSTIKAGTSRSTTLTVLTGLPGTGKTSTLIRLLQEHQVAGRDVKLYLSGENSLLTQRPNVVAGGRMGCRNPKFSFTISEVLKTDQAIERLVSAAPGSVAAFDEAQYFQPHIVAAWIAAAQRGVHVIISTPSASQRAALSAKAIQLTDLNIPCVTCGKRKSTVVIYKENLAQPTPVCGSCESDHYETTVAQLLNDVRESEPFKGEKKTYQPFYDLPMKGWTFVRPDSQARFEIIRRALSKYPYITVDPTNPGREFTYVDVGCCSGFFCDAFTTHGFSSTGVDVTKHFIDWAKRVALLKRQSIRYLQEDAEKFLTSSNSEFDVTSSFATIQWVMAQRNYNAGVNCFKVLFNRTRHVCVVEMGYSTEDIYKTKILDRPTEIDKDWVLRIMNEHGNFAHIDFYPAGHLGIWRDIFIGYKNMPADKSVSQITDWGSGLRSRTRRAVHRFMQKTRRRAGHGS